MRHTELSIEFFPPQTPEGVDKLRIVRGKLAALKPEFFSVTYGAGGSTRERTFSAVREIAAEGRGSRGALPLLPPPPDDSERDALRNRKPTLSEMMEKAIKPDCRNAYAGLGLLAIPPLIASSIGNGGCNW